MKELTLLKEEREASCKKKEISSLHSYVKDKAAKKVILHQNKHNLASELRIFQRNIKVEEIIVGQQRAMLKPLKARAFPIFFLSP